MAHTPESRDVGVVDHPAFIDAVCTQARLTLEAAASACAEWGQPEEAVALRIAADLIVSPAVVRRMRFEALIRQAADVERIAASPSYVRARDLSDAALAISVDCPVCGSRVYRGATACGSCGSPRPAVVGWSS